MLPSMEHLLMATALSALILPLGGQDAKTKSPGPEVGKPAPTTRLNDSGGVAVSVGGKSEHWTVLAFFPKAATPG